MDLGFKIAGLYGLRPNRLNFCGPEKEEERQLIYDYICGKKDFDYNTLFNIFSQFTGAFTYYKLIAEKNLIKNPFDEKVVRAYWIGNDLLEKINKNDMVQMIANNFLELGLVEMANLRIENLPSSAKPHHSFNVYYLGAVSGTITFNDLILDLCRIGWGKVKKVFIKEGVVDVVYMPIIKKREKFVFGRPVEKKRMWDKNLIPKIKKGDWVTFHWGQIVEKISRKEVAELKKYTENTIKNIKLKY